MIIKSWKKNEVKELKQCKLNNSFESLELN